MGAFLGECVGVEFSSPLLGESQRVTGVMAQRGITVDVTAAQTYIQAQGVV